MKEIKNNELVETLAPSLIEMSDAIIRDFGSEEKFELEMGTKENTKSKFIAIPKLITDNCIKYAFLQYEMGNYAKAKTLITKLLSIADHTQDLLKLHWGKLYISLIMKLSEKKYEKTSGIALFEELKGLRHRLEKKDAESYYEVISGRCSLLHYFLAAVYLFGLEPDYDYLIELFANDQYMSAIQCISPHLLRYLVLMLLLSKNKKKSAKYSLENVTATYEHNLCKYEDNVLKFLKLLLIDYNFPEANNVIKTFNQEISKDLFLSNQSALLVTNSQELLFEVFCSIYSTVEIEMISSYLDLNTEESEIWIVNLIRKNNIKARFRSDKKTSLEIKSKNSNAYQEVVKKSKDLLTKTNLLINNVTKLVNNPVV